MNSDDLQKRIIIKNLKKLIDNKPTFVKDSFEEHLKSFYAIAKKRPDVAYQCRCLCSPIK